MSKIWDIDLVSPTGTSPAADIQRIIDGFNTLRSNWSDATEPAAADRVAYMLWADTTAKQLKIRNHADTGWSVLGFSAGDVKLSMKSVADTGWVLMNDGTIGSATSGGTTRANADTEDLYTIIYNAITDTWAPVIGGRGASAAADFAANKALTLPKALGRALCGYGTGSVAKSGVDADVNLTDDTLTVPTNTITWITGMAAVFTLTSGTITGLTTGTTYYIIRDSATTVQLASSLANAQNGVAIDFTAKATPVWTLTHTFTTRVLGEFGGQESHAMSSEELLIHDHLVGQSSDGADGGVLNGPGSSLEPSGTTGGNLAMTIMQPSLFLNVMAKL